MMDADFIFRTDANSSSSSSPFVSFVSLWFVSPGLRGLRVSVVRFTFFPILGLWYNETSRYPGAHYERPGDGWAGEEHGWSLGPRRPLLVKDEC